MAPMNRLSLFVLFLASLLAEASVAQAPQQSQVTLDEGRWVLFYDLPSRRFPAIRASFVSRQFDAAAQDLSTSAAFIAVEASRSLPAIGERLQSVAASLSALAENLAEPGTTVSELDAIFGRAHWLLAQHYLYLARNDRDTKQYRMAGQYLWATTHHLERAVIWSNARIDRRLQNTLESLRELATRLQDPRQAERAIAEKPIVRAEALLVDLGKTIDRPVVGLP